VLELEAAVAVEYLPASQVEHVYDPEEGEKRPASHARQTLDDEAPTVVE